MSNLLNDFLREIVPTDQLCDTADCRRSAECGAGGRWSLGSALPRCQAVECSAPAPPRHGSVHAVRPGTTVRKYFSHNRPIFPPLIEDYVQVFRVGDIVKFQCSTGYMMSGSPVAACTHTRAWSRPAPACVTACTYPGTAQGGLIDKVTVDIYEDIYHSIYYRPPDV